MRAMPIRVFTGTGGARQMKAAFQKNWKHYLQEALGLAIFMMSACFFSTLLFSGKGAWQQAIHNDVMKQIVMGLLMGATAVSYTHLTLPTILRV